MSLIRLLTGSSAIGVYHDLRDRYRVWKCGRYEVIAVLAPQHCAIINRKARHLVDDTRHWRGLDYLAAHRIAARLNRRLGVM